MNAGKGVSQVANRCEAAKATGYLDAVYFMLKEYQINKCSLKNNGIKKFPKRMIEKFSKLMLLNMEGNKLTEVPADMRDWSELRALNLASNNLKTFPEAIYEMQTLQFVDVGNNEIEAIDFDLLLERLPDLRQLSVQGNPLASSADTRTKAVEAAKRGILIRLQ